MHAREQDRRPFEERLVTLWLAYADFERKLRQWKQVCRYLCGNVDSVVPLLYHGAQSNQHLNLHSRPTTTKPNPQAVKVFESATTDVVGEKAPTLWLEYARFCRERGKFANAQKVYLRAVEVLEPAQVGG